ncbi:MAG: endonuclease/exonuclease/phosphatase family protein [Sediminibacterium sp.]
MRKHSAIYPCLFIFLSSLFSCRSLQFYSELDKPFFYTNQKDVYNKEQTDSLNVVTFNIKKAIKIQLAIDELQQLEKTKKIDIYLLQEMNEQGVETIAKALHLNYLYIPIAYDKSDKKNIGNAILTKGTIDYPEKLILPHAKWQNRQRRDVTIGEVNIHQKKILVFSAHTETVAMSRSDRGDQVDSLIKRGKMLLPKYKYVLIGGDFNTLFPKDVQMVVEKFKSNGFDWSTSQVGTTARGMLGLVKPKNDYLFSKGFTLTNAYTLYSSRSSDHFPVLATFRY